RRAGKRKVQMTGRNVTWNNAVNSPQQQRPSSLEKSAVGKKLLRIPLLGPYCQGTATLTSALSSGWGLKSPCVHLTPVKDPVFRDNGKVLKDRT
ncbi:hypothetical protein KUCAC02_014298, partial [Chaenocephalus aceratus]